MLEMLTQPQVTSFKKKKITLRVASKEKQV